MKALLNSLNEDEKALVRETGSGELADMEEDGLVDLHTRIRRARDKYSKLYRRTASARVAEYGGRGKARPKNVRNAQKAEVFEDALARVSWHLARAARRSASELKAERIAAANPERAAPPRAGLPEAGPKASQTTPRRRPTSAGPALNRRHAATRAKGPAGRPNATAAEAAVENLSAGGREGGAGPPVGAARRGGCYWSSRRQEKALLLVRRRSLTPVQWVVVT